MALSSPSPANMKTSGYQSHITDGEVVKMNIPSQDEGIPNRSISSAAEEVEKIAPKIPNNETSSDEEASLDEDRSEQEHFRLIGSHSQGRPAFSIDSLLQRKVVHNSDQGIERNMKDRDEVNLRDSFPISSTIHLRSSSQPTPLVASSMSPKTNNPLDSLTFENILRSAAFQQNRSRDITGTTPLSPVVPPLPFIDRKLTHIPNITTVDTLPSPHSIGPGAASESVRPPNFEQLMILHHAQQQHKIIQQNAQRQDELRPQKPSNLLEEYNRERGAISFPFKDYM